VVRFRLNQAICRSRGHGIVYCAGGSVLLGAPALAQWSGHTSSKLQPAARGVPANLTGVEAAIVNLTNDIRRRHGFSHVA